ncbi:1,5-anhydro-D-fructose reductase-like [Oppia nitens]|uniref:1,5-anhydro-D-fructose reductase-like n=1 Tax=Oppia nitens TaxID=1686743 RepID=UPI0023DC2414|nr:1,5-anhydro-D-fructose reductase-like [Oppia nitens]XP_054153872.1 1,5-anhydro-D-fructose reductase-like [Oppia nitens]XP_054153873.1 1,5-anhydro-D-fructose reductase-like [Oppia nitens]
MVDPKQVPTVKFNNGVEVPVIGLGTWQAPRDGSLYRSVRTAIECGYRHFDCALVYRNEEETGRAINDAIKDGLVTREELFIVSKVWITYLKRDRVMDCVKKILEKFQTPYLDLALIHWPMCFAQVDDTLFPTDADGKIIGGDVDYIEAYQGLEDCVKAGLVRSIGISNFTSAQVDRLVKAVTIVPVTNQVEAHPYLNQNKLRKFCEERGITLTAYSPLGNPGSVDSNPPDRGCLLKDPVILRLAQKYGKNAGQILLKFQTDRNIIVVPKSVNPDRIKSNIQIFDFKLTDEELQELESLDRNYRSNLFEITRDLPNHPFDPSIDF